jgi:nitroreductase/NAD-dependent dihydropyrimidine dehydrogenase PreA subunit
MNFLTVDQDKCKRDRICAAECPSKLIVFKENASFPEAVRMAEQYCIRCGHCMAVCPNDAISVSTVNGDYLPVDPGLLPAANQVEHFLKSRRSIRGFKDKAVDHAVLEKIIEISSYAPSGHNTQPVHWMIIEDNKIQEIAALVVDWMRYMIKSKPEFAAAMSMKAICMAWDRKDDRICRNAPHIIIAHAPQDMSSSQGACTIALSYLELAAYSMGMGACWAGFVGMAAAVFPPLIKELALPEGHKVFGAMLVGYPKYTFSKIPPRNEPKIIWK